jgi:hypothetical protein
MLKFLSLRWILPILGLIVFSVISYNSFRWHRQYAKDSHIFQWSSIHLDSDPLNRHPSIFRHPQCPPEQPNCFEWDLSTLAVEPGFLTRALMLSAFPAFIVGVVVVDLLGRVGVSQVASFMVSMPILIFAWFYLVGRALTKWAEGTIVRIRGRRPSAPTPS